MNAVPAALTTFKVVAIVGPRPSRFNAPSVSHAALGVKVQGLRLLNMTLERDAYVIRQSESGDYFIVPLEKADTFWEDELEGDADYAVYVDLFEVQIYDYEV